MADLKQKIPYFCFKNKPYFSRLKMSELLDALITQRNREALDYKAYLVKLVELTRQVSKPETHSKYPLSINSPARRALCVDLKGLPGLDEPLYDSDSYHHTLVIVSTRLLF